MLILLNSLWLGILTSLNPCQLTSNFAIIAYLSRNINKPLYTFIASLIYISGRIFLYSVLGMFLSYSINSVGLTSIFLQTKMNIIIAIIMIIIGLILSGIVNIKFKYFGGFLHKLKEKCKNHGLIGVFLLGILFASTFCPISATLFFGNLIQNNGKVINFFIYGIGTGVPIIMITTVLTFSVNKIAKLYNSLLFFEKYSTKFTGLVFICSGIYFLFEILN